MLFRSFHLPGHFFTPTGHHKFHPPLVSFCLFFFFFPSFLPFSPFFFCLFLFLPAAATVGLHQSSDERCTRHAPIFFLLRFSVLYSFPVLDFFFSSRYFFFLSFVPSECAVYRVREKCGWRGKREE